MAKIDLDFFEKIIIQHTLKRESVYIASIIDYLDKDLFKDSAIADIIDIIKTFYLERNVVPTLTELKLRVNTVDLKDSLKKVVGYIKELDGAFSEEELIANTEYFIKQRRYGLLTEKILDFKASKKEFDLDDIQKESEKIHAVTLIDNLGLDYFEDNHRVVEYLQETESVISTGYPSLDDAFGGGFQKEGKAIYDIGGETNVGKAQPCSLIIRTPDGERRFGDLKVGDTIFGKNGKPVNITHIHPQGIKKIYKVKFMDGRETLCCSEHLWTVYHPEYKLNLQTQGIKYLMEKSSSNIFGVPLCDPVEFKDSDFRGISPEELGYLYYSEEYTHNEIPDKYLDLSVRHRMYLLFGFFSNFRNYKNPVRQESDYQKLEVYHEDVANKLVYIARSLGAMAKSYCFHKDLYIIHFIYSFDFGETIGYNYERLDTFKFIKNQTIVNQISSIEDHSEEEAMCITVDAEDHLYLTNDFIVTHNSICLANIALNVIMQDKNVVIISPEMSEMRYAKRISGMLTGIAISSLINDIENYKRYIKEFISKHKSKLIVKEVPTKGVSPKNIHAYLKKLKDKKGFIPDLICIDGHALLKPSTVQHSKHSELQVLIQECRGLSYMHNAPVLTVAQLNRGSHKASNPGLDAIAGSWDSIQDMDGHVNIWQTDEDREGNIIRFCGKKSRDGAKNMDGYLRIDYDTLRLYDEDGAIPDASVAVSGNKKLSEILDLDELLTNGK